VTVENHLYPFDHDIKHTTILCRETRKQYVDVSFDSTIYSSHVVLSI
jgi:hypothetical protein